MRAFMILLSYRALAWRHALRDKKFGLLARLGLGGYALFFLLNLALTWAAAVFLFRLTAPADHRLFLRLMAHGLNATAAALILTTAGHTALGSLYEAPYLNLAFAWPVDQKTLYAAGFTDTVVYSLAAVMALVAPAWIGTGLAAGASLRFILAGLAGFLAESLLGASLVCLMLVAILRLVGAAGMRRLFIIAVSLGIVGLVLVFQITALNSVGSTPAMALSRLDSFFVRLAWLPPGLAARAALAANGNGDAAGILLWGMTLGTTVLDVLLGGLTYQSCYTNLREYGRSASYRTGRRALSGRPRPVLALLRKDWRVLLRDPLFWSNAAVLSLVMLAFIWTTSRTMGAGVDPPAAAVLFLVAFISLGWMAQAGAMAVSREGSAWWILQASPLPAASVIRAKLLFGLSGLAGCFGLAGLTIIILGLKMPAAAFLMLTGGLSLGLAGAGLLADLALPDFTLRLEVRMTGAHAGGKAKIVLAILACLAVTVPAALVYFSGQALLGETWAAALVLGIGLFYMFLALIVGKRLLGKLLTAGA